MDDQTIKPQIGYYTAECCMLDLHKIETEEDLAEVMERIADSDDCGPLMVFRTLEEAKLALQENRDV